MKKEEYRRKKVVLCGKEEHSQLFHAFYANVNSVVTTFFKESFSTSRLNETRVNAIFFI